MTGVFVRGRGVGRASRAMAQRSELHRMVALSPPLGLISWSLRCSLHYVDIDVAPQFPAPPQRMQPPFAMPAVAAAATALTTATVVTANSCNSTSTCIPAIINVAVTLNFRK